MCIVVLLTTHSDRLVLRNETIEHKSNCAINRSDHTTNGSDKSDYPPQDVECDECRNEESEHGEWTKENSGDQCDYLSQDVECDECRNGESEHGEWTEDIVVEEPHEHQGHVK